MTSQDGKKEIMAFPEYPYQIRQLGEAEKFDKFGDGPWMKEPDSFSSLSALTDSSSGESVISAAQVAGVRIPNLGHWCGYVCVPMEHPWALVAAEDIDVSVHGGLTFSRRSPDSDWWEGGLWWVGFDCGHRGDMSPAIDRLLGHERGGTYRTYAYIRSEVGKLVAEAHRVAPNGCGLRYKKPTKDIFEEIIMDDNDE